MAKRDKKNILVAFIFLICAQISAQNSIALISGIKTAEHTSADLNNQKTPTLLGNKSNLQILLFLNQAVSDENKIQFKNCGIELLAPVDSKHWIALFTPNSKPLESIIYQLVTGFYIVTPQDKFSFSIEALPQDSLSEVNFELEYFTSSHKNLLLKKLDKLKITSNPLYKDRLVFKTNSKLQLLELASYAEVSRVSIVFDRIAPLNYISLGQGNASLPKLKTGLDGTGVCIGIGDIGLFEQHIDFQHRVTHYDTNYYFGYTYHPTMVTGNMAGAGILNEYLEGFAPKSKIISAQYSNILYNGQLFYKQARMIAANHSYSLLPPPFVSNCNTYGLYNYDCRTMDNLVRQINYQSHVVASGNNTIACSGFPSGYANLAEGYQASKNGITVGIVGNTDVVTSSSRGPTRDKRIKPDMVARGINITSDFPTNTLATSSGSSYSTPNVTGSIALLVQRYRQLNAGKDPESALVKALMLNSAKDIGNAGPDFASGFGRLDIENAIKNTELGRYTSGSVAHNDSFSYTITVPSGASNLKIMLYWHDTTGSVISYKALLNDLDLKVIDPSSTVYLPYVLDTLVANVANTATTGKDRLNNAEQVGISSPAAGSYTIKVYGYDVALGPQKFHLVYTYSKPSVKLAWPTDGEVLFAGITQNIRIEEQGISTGTYTLEVSANGGGSWTALSTTVANGTVVYTGWTPTTAGDIYQLRITHNSLAYSDTVINLVVLGRPTLSSISSCGRQVNLGWTTVTGATDYEVLRLQGGFWTRAAITTGTTITIKAFANVGEQEWYVVRARLNGSPGKRNTASAIAISNATCGVATQMGAFELMYPLVGRKFTHSELKSNQTLQVRNRNFGNNAISTTINTGFSFNGSSGSTSYTQSLTINDTASTIFSSGINLSSTGTYNYKIWSSISDANAYNDTISGKIRHLANAPITLPYLLDFESAVDTVYEQQAFGLDGIEMVDFYSTNFRGRLKTHPGALMTKGNRALCMDKKNGTASYEQNYAYITLNLSSYSASKVSMGFDYRLVGETFHTGDSVWVRGADSLPWLPVYALKDAGAKSDFYTVKDVEIGTAMTTAGQTPSASFQIRIGQYDNKRMRSYIDSAGIIVDNLRLYETTTDVAITKILSPATQCGQGTDTVRITFKNNSNGSLTNFPFAYKLDNGAWIKDTFVGTVNANTSANFSFKTLLNINDNLAHTLTLVQLKTGDLNSFNDTLKLENFRFIKKITALPFLDNFETATPFYAEGVNSSWSLGTPAGNLIKYAASGNNAWTTGLGVDYNDMEQSYLYSPCFNLSSASTDLKISFHNAHNLETDYDAYWLEYSSDLVNWTKLGTSGSTYNWYNNISPTYLWDSVRSKWRVSGAEVPVSSIVNKQNVQFRFAFKSDAAVHYDGVNLDDFHLFDSSTGVYSGSTLTQTKTGTGNGWVHFQNGKNYFLSINDSLQALGNSIGGVHPFVGAMRQYNGQYTMNRSWWILPTNSISGNIKARIYYTEKEADDLLNIDPVIDKFKQFGVTKYHGPKEDSVFYNDTWDATAYKYFQPELKIVPFYNGQYLEFTSTGLSEFWINAGTMTQTVPLATHWLSVKGQKLERSNDIEWNIVSDCVERLFEVYGYPLSDPKQVMKLGSILSNCTQGNYHFYDTQFFKVPAVYFIKSLEFNGNNSTSESVFIDTKNAGLIRLFPNPNNGKFFITFPNNKLKYDIKLFNQQGQLVYQQINLTQKVVEIDLTNRLSKGVYILEVGSERVKVVVH